MRRRIVLAIAGLTFLVSLTLLIWQGSFSFGSYGPANIQQTSIIWAVSTLIFLLTVTLGFMLFRTSVKLYVERRSNREGSRIRSKLILGALGLTLTPVLFSILFSVYVLNNKLDKWFSRPARLRRDQSARCGSRIPVRISRPRSSGSRLVERPPADTETLCSRVMSMRLIFGMYAIRAGCNPSSCIGPDGSSLALCRSKLDSSMPLLEAHADILDAV